jgi:hypothetical protein
VSSLRVFFVLISKSGLGVPSWARAGGTPLAYPHDLQVSLGVLGSREGLPEPRLRPCSQHQSLVGHLKEFRPYLGIAVQALLELQQARLSRHPIAFDLQSVGEGGLSTSAVSIAALHEHPDSLGFPPTTVATVTIQSPSTLSGVP